LIHLRTLTILVDNREQKCLRFPAYVSFRHLGRSNLWKVAPKLASLRTADYALEGYLRAGLLERKGDLSELYRNLLTGDRPRFFRELVRMRDTCRHPALFLDMPLAELLKPSRYFVNPEYVLDALFSACQRYGIALLLVPPGRDPTGSGLIVLKWLLAAALSEGD
jgi:hypothetical protein